MGLFDNVLKAIENGAVEKRLAGAVDTLETGLDRAIGKAESTAAAPERLLGRAEQTGQHLQAALPANRPDDEKQGLSS